MTPMPTPNGNRVLAWVDYLTGRRWLSTAVAAILLLAVPAIAGTRFHMGVVSAWSYYGGNDDEGRSRDSNYRMAAIAVVERAGYIQGAPSAERPTYRWASGPAGAALGFVETERGRLPLTTRTFPGRDGETDTLGVVQGDTKAIVVAMTTRPMTLCRHLARLLSPYARAAASVAVMDETAIDESTVSRAEWTPLEEGMAACRARMSAGNLTGRATILLSFRGRPADL